MFQPAARFVHSVLLLIFGLTRLGEVSTWHDSITQIPDTTSFISLPQMSYGWRQRGCPVLFIKSIFQARNTTSKTRMKEIIVNKNTWLFYPWHYTARSLLHNASVPQVGQSLLRDTVEGLLRQWWKISLCRRRSGTLLLTLGRFLEMLVANI